VGKDADIVVFDPEAISDTATYENPSTPPTGLSQVMVNGELVVDKGELTGKKPGKSIRFG
jgi:N-acyl-D-amino-acid deacylase